MKVKSDSLEKLFPVSIQHALALIEPSWLAIIVEALKAMDRVDPAYLPGLIEGQFLPAKGKLFAAFSIPLDQVRYVLVGEGPYPRDESATGYCFMDGAVNELWSKEPQGGLSKKVNRATSLRNFIKMLLVADGYLDVNHTSGTAMAVISSVARQADSGFIHSLPELQENMIAHGFLLLNASLVYRTDVAPQRDARAWQAFLQVVFSALNEHQQSRKNNPISLVLWGKIAQQLKQIPACDFFRHVTAEHPYNLSFIANQTMQHFFSPMRLLAKSS